MDYEAKAKEFIHLIPKMRAAPRHSMVDKLSQGEGHMLIHLYMNGGAMMAGELAKCACVSTARVTAMLRGSEEKGYIERLPVEGDRRKIKVALTEEGEKLVLACYEEAVQNTASFFEALGEEDTEHLLRILKRTQEIFANRSETEKLE